MSERTGSYITYSDLMQFYDRKRKECPKGVTLKLERGKNLLLQFINPDTNKRSSKACGVAFTEKGILEAVDKAWKVSETGDDKKAKWVPKSACEVEVRHVPGPGILTIDPYGLEKFDLEDWV